jgi:hypothetical protein
MLQLEDELMSISGALLSRYQDGDTMFRASITYWYGLGHLHSHVRAGLQPLEAAVETSILGDRLLALIGIGAIALSRFYASDNLSDVEALCTHTLEEFPGVSSDLRGGPLLIGVRQVVRALQGKTRLGSATTVLTDDGHDSEAYVAGLASRPNPNKALDQYLTLALIPLYMFEHYDEAIRMGEMRRPMIAQLWTFRATRLHSFYVSLALLAALRQDPSRFDKNDVVRKVKASIKSIKDWEVLNDANYAAWSRLLTAELSDVMDDSSQAMQAYDAALTHAQEHGFILEEALTHELAAGFYMRRGAKRAGQAFVKEAILAYRRVNAHGKATQVSEKYASLLQDQMQSRAMDAACQTDYPGDAGSEPYHRLAVAENDRRIANTEGLQSSQDRTRNWVAPGPPLDKNEVPGFGIDVIDLQSKPLAHTARVPLNSVC